MKNNSNKNKQLKWGVMYQNHINYSESMDFYTVYEIYEVYESMKHVFAISNAWKKLWQLNITRKFVAKLA